jgi:Protein of unknown function (DUF3306)
MVRETGPDDGFLSRWSRRKREVEAEAKAAEIKVAEPEPMQPDHLHNLKDIAPESPEAGEINANPEAEPAPEFIEPPSLDIIDKDFDLAHWLKQNVPESWKLAALRRTWETDPFIHGYLNPAREYALDWNTPGGAPGYGPLTESDDVKSMVARIFGDKPAEKAEAPVHDEAQLSGDEPEQHKLSDDTGVPETGIIAMQHKQQMDGGLTGGITADNLTTPLNAVRLSKKEPVRVDAVNTALQHKPSPEPTESAPVLRLRRRGGGAIPV